jgi:penicillin amidase
MQRGTRILLAVLVVVLLVGVIGFGYLTYLVRRPWPDVDGTVRLDGLDARVTVIRDSWGVPHIYAATSHDLFFAQGYVHAQDRFWQMEFSRRAGTGRLAELLGPSALESDRFIRTLGWHRTAAQELEGLDEDVRSVLQAYAEGVNAYVRDHEGRLGLEFSLLELSGVSFDIQPWTPYDTLTWAKVMAWSLGGNMGEELLRAHIVDRLGTSAVDVLMPSYPAHHPVIVPHSLDRQSLDAVPEAAMRRTHILGGREYTGSNNWVVAGSRTETGMPLLANDPHLFIQMPSIWHEVGLHCEPAGPHCPFNVTGVSFPGSPGVIAGHNDRIAWGVTNVDPDVQDLFIERVHPDDPNRYEYEGEWLEMEIVREEIHVAGQEEPVVVNVRITRHGPIINDIVSVPDEEWAFGWQPLALSWTSLQPGTLMQSVLYLDRAHDWDAFRMALAYWDAPSQNFVYADVEGNIGYQATGRIPIRASGDGTLPVPGWSGEYEWVDVIPYDALPRSFNPPEGYVVTANNAIVEPDYPYLISTSWAPGYRARRIVDMIEELTPLSSADFQTIHGDGCALYALEILPYLHDLSPDAPRLEEALALLQGWDGDMARESAAAALFASFQIHLAQRTFSDELGEELMGDARTQAMIAIPDLLAQPHAPWFDDITTPETETREEILLQALQDAVEELTDRLGRNVARWSWGELHTARFENQGLGQSGIGPVERLFNRGPVQAGGGLATVNATSYNANQPYTVLALPSYRQIVDLGDLSRSLSMHTTGQSGHPFHPHYADMIEPWRDVEYHPMLWTRSQVEADAEGVMVLEP